MARKQINITKAALVCQVVSLILEMLIDIPDVSSRIDKLKDVELMLDAFDCIQGDLQNELLGIRAWCSEIRLLRRDDIDTPSFPLSFEIVNECYKKLMATLHFVDKVKFVLKVIEQKSRVPTMETARLCLQGYPNQAARIICLHTLLEGVMLGLDNINFLVNHGRDTPFSRLGLQFEPYDEPLKMMWQAAVDGLQVLTKHCPTTESMQALDGVYCWGRGKFEDPFPLDLYFDYTVSGQNCREMLEKGLFFNLYHTDAALKAIPCNDKLAVPIEKARSQLSNILKKDIFLDKALSFWCDEVITLKEKHELANEFSTTGDTKTGHAESDNTKTDNPRSDDTESDDVSSLDFIRHGLRMVLRVQEDIDADYAVLAKNPELESLASQRAVIAVAPRLQAMTDHGIVESAKPVPNDTPSWREQVAQGGKDRELAEQSESSKAGGSGELGLPSSDDNEPVDGPSGIPKPKTHCLSRTSGRYPEVPLIFGTLQDSVGSLESVQTKAITTKWTLEATGTM